MTVTHEAGVVDADDLGLSLVRQDATVVLAAAVLRDAYVDLRDEPDPFVAQLIERVDAIAGDEQASPDLVRRAWRRVMRAFARLRAVAAGTRQTRVVTYVRRYSRTGRVGRVGLHRAQRSWYGRRRSTSERNAARVASSRAAAREGDLPRHPPEFIDWLTNFIETLRGEQEMLHPAQHQWRGTTYVNHLGGARRVGQDYAGAGTGVSLEPHDVGQGRGLARRTADAPPAGRVPDTCDHVPAGYRLSLDPGPVALGRACLPARPRSSE